MGAEQARPRNWLQRRSLRERIGGTLAVLVFLVAGGLGGLIGQSAINQARARIGQSLAVDAQRLAERLDTEMAARARELGLLAGTDVLQEIPATATDAPGLGPIPRLSPALLHTQSLLDGLKRSFPFYTWIAVADASGRVLAATDPASIGSDISARSLAVEDLRLRGGATLRLSAPDPHVLSVVQPIRAQDGRVIGVVAAQLAGTWLQALAQAVVTPDLDGVTRRETFLIGTQDTVLLGPSGPLLGRAAGQRLPVAVPMAIIARARAGFTGASVEAWPEGGDFLTGSAFAAEEGEAPGPGSQTLRWAVLVRQAEDAAFAPAYALRRIIWLVGLGIAGGFALMGWVMAGMITAPLHRIADAAERLRQGDDIEIPRIRGAAEIASLATSLRALVATLTRRQIALDEMEELALRDPLTGLLNRHGLRLAVDRLLSRVLAEHSSVMVFVGDLDGFKAVNDTLGHASGDRLLCQVAARLSRTVRSGDIVARLGGDEFVLALPAPEGPEDRSARAVAQRALAAITAPYQVDGAQIHVGCSFGGACWPDHVRALVADDAHPPDLDVVMEQADAALYRAKRSGRGQIMMHGELPRLA